MFLSKYIKTAQMCSKNLTNGGVLYLLLSYLLKVIYVIPILLLWRSLMQGGVNVGMTLPQMLTYTFMGAILSEVLVVRTPASSWLYEGVIISLYQRPMNILTHLTAQTIGGWLPELMFYTLPMIIAAPIFGISLKIQSLWFFPSLLLCISLGFAIDFLYACLTIRLKNASWLVYVIRTAIVSLLSGSVIPFAILPWGLGEIFKFLPFGSLAGAPLSIYAGLSEPTQILIIQISWNIVLWPASILAFRKSQERMVSYGG